MKRKTAALEIRCPHCGQTLTPRFIRSAAGRLVGAIRGSSKAHSPEAARAAVMVRWTKAKGK